MCVCPAPKSAGQHRCYCDGRCLSCAPIFFVRASGPSFVRTPPSRCDTQFVVRASGPSIVRIPPSQHAQFVVRTSGPSIVRTPPSQYAIVLSLAHTERSVFETILFLIEKTHHGGCRISVKERFMAWWGINLGATP